MRWKREWTQLVLLFLTLRLVYSALGFIVASGPDPEPLASGPIYEAAEGLLRTGPVSDSFINVWFRWDTGWYLKISGFGYDPTDGSAVFPPLYPLLVRLLSTLTWDYLFSALLISNLAILASFILLYEVACAEGMDPKKAHQAVFSLAFFPSAFFLFTAYTDSLFLALALGTWLAARRGQWLTAGLLGGLATICRLQGVLLFPVLVLAWTARLVRADRSSPAETVTAIAELLMTREGWKRFLTSLIKPSALGIFIPALAFAGYTAFLHFSGLGSIPAALETHWGIRTVTPWAGVLLFFDRLSGTPRIFMDYIDLTALLIVLALLVAGMGRLSPMLSLYAWLTLAIIFMRGTPPHLLGAFNRFALSLFPAFLVYGRLQNRLVRLFLWVLSFAVQVFLVLGFLDWRWVG